MAGKWHNLEGGGQVFMDTVNDGAFHFPSGIRALGVGLIGDNPRALIVTLTEPPGDVDIRALHDFLVWRPSALDAEWCVNMARQEGDSEIGAGGLRGPTGKVFLRCEFCGNAKIVSLEKTDPPGTVSVVTNECDICNAASGGFEHVKYFDRDGNQIAPCDPDWCDACQNTGEVDCLCGGDLCVCGTETMPCPRCGKGPDNPVGHEPEFSPAVLKAMVHFHAKRAEMAEKTLAAIQEDGTDEHNAAVRLRQEVAELRLALAPFAKIEVPPDASDGTWVAKTLYCNDQVTAASVLRARAAIAKATA